MAQAALLAALGGLAVLWIAAGVARAMPGAMPWDHAGGAGRPDCTACHFDAGAVKQSAALHVTGLPEKAVSGKTYDLTLRLETDGLVTAGFLMRAETGEADADMTSGRFLPADERTEANDGAIRSTQAGAAPAAPGTAQWRFSWKAPADLEGDLTFYIASVAGNDDASPLGDRVHLREVRVPPPSGER